MSVTIVSERTGNSVVFEISSCEKKEGSPSSRGESLSELDEAAKQRYRRKLDPQQPKKGEELLDGLDTSSLCGE